MQMLKKKKNKQKQRKQQYLKLAIGAITIFFCQSIWFIYVIYALVENSTIYVSMLNVLIGKMSMFLLTHVTCHCLQVLDKWQNLFIFVVSTMYIYMYYY